MKKEDNELEKIADGVFSPWPMILMGIGFLALFAPIGISMWFSADPNDRNGAMAIFCICMIPIVSIVLNMLESKED